jgi:hypothetical protein
MPDSANYRRRADPYRALAAKLPMKERDGPLLVATLLEALAQNIEREEAQQQPKA